MFNIGLKALKSFVEKEDSYAFYKAKLTQKLFKGEELTAFNWVHSHFSKFQTLPHVDTFSLQFPEILQFECVEPPAYYVDLIEKRFIYDAINKANISCQDLLRDNQNDVEAATTILSTALATINEQKHRQQLLDLGLEGGALILNTYNKVLVSDTTAAFFGWPYLDDIYNGTLPGDVVSFVGRPATGKSWFSLYTSLYNWTNRNLNVLFVSMEMNLLAVTQRIAAMYTNTNISQLKTSGFSSTTYSIFYKKLKGLSKEPAKFYVVDGNLAASVDEVYALASQLNCKLVFIDGAYLLKNKNTRLDRYTKVAENVELMKKYSTSLDLQTFASWQFNRQAAKKDRRKGEKVGLEDIGYSDAIPQISSIVLGLMQEDGVETIESRKIEVLKGRNGETGSFDVNWNFITMDFSQKMLLAGKGEFEPLDFL